MKSKEEIFATIDAGGHNRGLRFDVEMLRYCGTRARVLRRVNRIVDEKTGRSSSGRATASSSRAWCAPPTITSSAPARSTPTGGRSGSAASTRSPDPGAPSHPPASAGPSEPLSALHSYSCSVGRVDGNRTPRPCCCPLDHAPPKGDRTCLNSSIRRSCPSSPEHRRRAAGHGRHRDPRDGRGQGGRHGRSPRRRHAPPGPAPGRPLRAGGDGGQDRGDGPHARRWPGPGHPRACTGPSSAPASPEPGRRPGFRSITIPTRPRRPRVRELAREYRATVRTSSRPAAFRRSASSSVASTSPGGLADTAGYSPDLSFEQKVEILETMDVEHGSRRWWPGRRRPWPS